MTGIETPASAASGATHALTPHHHYPDAAIEPNGVTGFWRTLDTPQGDGTFREELLTVTATEGTSSIREVPEVTLHITRHDADRLVIVVDGKPMLVVDKHGFPRTPPPPFTPPSAKLDPLPWTTGPSRVRAAREYTDRWRFDPRPEYSQNREDYS